MPSRLTHSAPPSMQRGELALNPNRPMRFVGSDGRLQIDVPSGAINAADVASAGGRLSLVVRQIAPASGATAGGSGHCSVHPLDATTQGTTDAAGNFRLYSPAFESEETLARTLYHERTHVWQVRTYGMARLLAMGRDLVEAETYAADQRFWDAVRAR